MPALIQNRPNLCDGEDAWFGCEIAWSEDMGVTWEKATEGPAFTAESGLKLDRIWHIEPGPIGQPNVLYAGVAPSGFV